MNTRSSIVRLILISFLLVATSCNSKGGEEQETGNQNKRKETPETVQSNPNISGMVAKYSAAVDWNRRLEELVTPYTVDVQEALVRPSNQPVFFLASLDDVVKQDNKYFLRLLYLNMPEIHFILECKQDLAIRVLNYPERLFVEYAVIASISSVAKPEIKVKSEALSGEDRDTEIQLGASDIFIAKGACLDLQLVQHTAVQ